MGQGFIKKTPLKSDRRGSDLNGVFKMPHYAFRTPSPSFIQDSETGKSEKNFLNQEYLQLLIGL